MLALFSLAGAARRTTSSVKAVPLRRSWAAIVLMGSAALALTGLLVIFP
jgi:hypothetical protein